MSLKVIVFRKKDKEKDLLIESSVDESEHCYSFNENILSDEDLEFLFLVLARLIRCLVH